MKSSTIFLRVSLLAFIVSACGGVQTTSVVDETLLPTTNDDLASQPTEVPAVWPPLEEDPWPSDKIAPWPTNGWSTSSPEAQGIDSTALLEMLESLQSDDAPFHSLLLIRNGYLVLEVYWSPYTADDNHGILSITKTIVSALVGINNNQGYFSDVDQPITDLFPDLDIDNVDEGITSVTVMDVLTMTSGMDWSGNLPQTIFQGTVEHEPGTYFQYNNTDPQLLSNAIQSMSGLDPLEFAQEQLFGPLGISEEDVAWGRLGGEVRDGGTGIRLRPRDMAKIGYLYLNNGMWDGEEILKEDWIEQSVYPYVFDNFSGAPPADGYGYNWWINREMGFYAAVGYGGQMIVVFPGKNMIVVTTGDAVTTTGRTHYRTLTNFIVPLELSASPLPENPTALADLQALVDEIGGFAD